MNLRPSASRNWQSRRRWTGRNHGLGLPDQVMLTSQAQHFNDRKLVSPPQGGVAVYGGDCRLIGLVAFDESVDRVRRLSDSNRVDRPLIIGDDLRNNRQRLRVLE